jgi:hypothetical protein
VVPPPVPVGLVGVLEPLHRHQGWDVSMPNRRYRRHTRTRAVSTRMRPTREALRQPSSRVLEGRRVSLARRVPPRVRHRSESVRRTTIARYITDAQYGHLRLSRRTGCHWRRSDGRSVVSSVRYWLIWNRHADGSCV